MKIRILPWICDGSCIWESFVPFPCSTRLLTVWKLPLPISVPKRWRVSNVLFLGLYWCSGNNSVWSHNG
jgi:hypothetical protein